MWPQSILFRFKFVLIVFMLFSPHALYQHTWSYSFYLEISQVPDKSILWHLKKKKGSVSRSVFLRKVLMKATVRPHSAGKSHSATGLVVLLDSYLWAQVVIAASWIWSYSSRALLTPHAVSPFILLLLFHAISFQVTPHVQVGRGHTPQRDESSVLPHNFAAMSRKCGGPGLFMIRAQLELELFSPLPDERSTTDKARGAVHATCSS